MQIRRPGLFIFDLDGVIYRGDTVLPFAADTLATLRAAGDTVFFLTNNSTRTRDSYARKLQGMGIAATADEVMTSAHATALYFQEHGLTGATAYVIGEVGIIDELTRVGAQVVEGDPDTRVDCVVVGLDRDFTYHKLQQAQQAIQAGARFIATNTDRTFPVEGGRIIPGGGSLVAAVEAATGVAPLVIGKPEQFSLRKILEITGKTPENAVVIGDRLDTDVLAGRRMGMRTVLVLTGVTTERDIIEAPVEMRPNHVIADLSCLQGMI